MSDDCRKAFEEWYAKHGDQGYTEKTLQGEAWQAAYNTNRWIPVTERLPEGPSPVLVYGKNSAGKKRRLRAMYARKFELEAYENDDADYLEEADEFFAKPGWYENNDFEEVHWLIDFPVTHWQPLPEAPHE